MTAYIVEVGGLGLWLGGKKNIYGKNKFKNISFNCLKQQIHKTHIHKKPDY